MQRIGTLLVVGVGLIGGSLALALRRRGLVERVIGHGRERRNLARARELGAIDEAAADLADAAPRADVIFVAVPVGAMAEVFERIAGRVGADAVVTDAGSVKRGPIAAARRCLGADAVRFVPGHPIAGSERSGVEAARADLYDRHKVLLTPFEESDPRAVERVAGMWRAVGATVETMTADRHDRILGLTSHLPHVLAFALVEYIAGDRDAERCFDLAAGGFLDFTRIASSDPAMWRDICAGNRDALRTAVDGYLRALHEVRDVLDDDPERLESIFARAKEARDRLLDRRSGAHDLRA